MRALVLTNPRAGRGRPLEAGRRAVEVLRVAGHEATLAVTERALHAVELAAAARDDCDLLVAVGGDGTLREALVGLGDAASRVDLGFVPVGNANVVAREVGIPLDPRAALAILTGGAPRPIDVGEVDDGTDRRLFLAMVGVGFDALVTRGVERWRRTGLGAWAYAHGFSDVIYAACALPALVRVRPCRFTLEAEGRALVEGSPTILVCNTQTYAKGWSMTPEARIESGCLHWVATRDARAHHVLAHLRAAATGRSLSPRLATYGVGTRLRLTAPVPFRWQVDGDCQAPAQALDLEVRPGFASLLGPP